MPMSVETDQLHGPRGFAGCADVDPAEGTMYRGTGDINGQIWAVTKLLSVVSLAVWQGYRHRFSE